MIGLGPMYTKWIDLSFVLQRLTWKPRYGL